MSEPLTFEAYEKKIEHNSIGTTHDIRIETWNARQPEIDAHKADVAYWRRIAIQADEIIEENDVEIERLTRERDAAVVELGALATSIENEPCTHGAYCRDEMMWRREIAAAEAAALERAANVVSGILDRKEGLGIHAESEAIRALIPKGAA